MKANYQEIWFALAVGAGCVLFALSLLSRVVIFAGRLAACIRCGCELNAGTQVCLTCGHSLHPRASRTRPESESAAPIGHYEAETQVSP